MYHEYAHADPKREWGRADKQIVGSTKDGKIHLEAYSRDADRQPKDERLFVTPRFLVTRLPGDYPPGAQMRTAESFLCGDESVDEIG